MIKDSSYCRNDILRIAKFLEKKCTQTHWTEKSFSKTEKMIMLSFFIIRKLLEARKTSGRISNLSVTLFEFNRGLRAKQDVVYPILQVDYDLNHPHKTQKDLLFICHQIIHSFVFSVAVSYSKGFDGIYFSSDFQKNKKLFFLPVENIIITFTEIAHDPEADFSPWVEERLDKHRIQTAFPIKR